MSPAEEYTRPGCELAGFGTEIGEPLRALSLADLVKFNRREHHEEVARRHGVWQDSGQPVWIEFPESAEPGVQIGHVILTKAGQQLAPICGSRPREGFVEYVREKWRGFGYKTEPTEPVTPPER
jgi:hypothetical protein